jgi:hypothetical protein
VATDLTPRADTPDVVVSRVVHRRRGLLLLLAAVFNLWVWGTRMRNLLADADSFSTAFVGVHVALYVAATAVALVVGGIGLRQWREGRRPADAPA